MAGIKQFDEAAALKTIMEVFWRQGYEAASIDDLVAATGLKRGSLYNAFGSKERMFLLAFEGYVEAFEEELLTALDRGSLREGLTALFDRVLGNLEDGGTPPGCFIANHLSDVGRRDDKVTRALKARLEKTERRFYQRLLRAQAEGEIPPGIDLLAKARYLAGLFRMIPLTQQASGSLRAAADVAREGLAQFTSGIGKPPTAAS